MASFGGEVYSRGRLFDGVLNRNITVYIWTPQFTPPPLRLYRTSRLLDFLKISHHLTIKTPTSGALKSMGVALLEERIVHRLNVFTFSEPISYPTFALQSCSWYFRIVRHTTLPSQCHANLPNDT